MKFKASRGFEISSKELAKRNPLILVAIRIKYPNIETLRKFKFKKRTLISRDIVQRKKNELIKLINKSGFNGEVKNLDDFQVTAKVNFAWLEKIRKLPYVEHVEIREISGVVRRPEKEYKKQFYGLAIKVRIEIEGVKKKDCLHEFVVSMIKAKTLSSAKKKVRKTYKKSESPYLNSDGQIVTWKFVKFLNYYETSIYDAREFNGNQGVEIFSQFVNNKKEMRIFKR